MRVPRLWMAASRKGEREAGKSDQMDELAVARAGVKDGVEQLQVAYLNEQAVQTRLLIDQGSVLDAERTRPTTVGVVSRR